MSLSAAALPEVTEEAWLAAQEERDQPFLEVVSGEFVVKRTGGNPHHAVARRLANAFEEQWAGVSASAPGNWVLNATPLLARVPDVLVDGPELLTEPAYHGVPIAVAEVWSPTNTLQELLDKRREYLQTGLTVLVELYVDRDLRVHVEWKRPVGLDWQVVAAAAGTESLVVDPEHAQGRAFTIVPDRLLRP